ncbi:hypothetical protein [Massilia aerilata]|uniref:Phage tail protein n=1 Tax=Massilia aerilata TaxID=453817 RepID=A0ABW0S4R5_9BURK
MSTAWTLAAADVCNDALEHLGVIGAGEAASGDDMQLALRALDAVLKELPLAGYSWPKLSAETALAWTGGQSIPLPVDYFSAPAAWRLVNGRKVALTQVPHARWAQMCDSGAAGMPTHFYVGPDQVLNLWPAPDTDPVVKLQYQRIVGDADGTVTPDVPQYMLNALGYGVANELILKFDTPDAKAQVIAARWQAKRAAALEYAIESAPICFEVRD